MLKSTQMKRYEQFPHTADIGIRVFGKDLKELFENAAFALFDTLADLEGLKPSIEETVKVAGDSPEGLLVAWLDELIAAERAALSATEDIDRPAGAPATEQAPA